MKLPEMSVIDTHLPSNTKIRGYTVEQMLAWGKATSAAEREACAAICEEEEELRDHTPFDAALRIRARGENT
jgi:hypothetical protein